MPPKIRAFLRDHQLQSTIKCLVTFYGVPLRIMERANSPLDNLEMIKLRDASKRVDARLASMVGNVERRALEFDPNFAPASTDPSLDGLARRLKHAGDSLDASMGRTTDPQARERLATILKETAQPFAQPVDIDTEWNTSTAPAATQQTPPTQAQLTQLIEKPFDRTARGELRQAARKFGGILAYARILQNQMDYLTTDASGSAFDNELALVWWPPYARKNWQPNPLNPHFSELRTAPVLMVTRLDAPTPQLVRDMIANSLATEREGLKGKLVVDSRGIAAKNAAGNDDAFGMFDERLRRLAKFAETKTDVPVKFDDSPGVLPSGSVDDVAMYCGWYSLRNYVPGMKFVRGAVGYHVASFELLSLHNPIETGWVHGLLQSGVVGTLGPVAEPYLHSFPPPEEFFPLLMTGKLTLAEVYWASNPLTSWMQTFIGDPLYTPFAKDPKVKVEDLPEFQQSLFHVQ